MGILGACGRTLLRGWSALVWRVGGYFLRRARYDTLEIELSGTLPERWVPGSPLEMMRPPRLTHRLLVELLDIAANDPKLKRVIFHLGPLAVGPARLQELARGIGRLRAAGTETIALCESLSTREYLLAAACDRRVMTPTAHLNLIGLRLEISYFRGLLDKIDVEPDLLVAGKYKNAAETFTRQSPSKAAREMTDGLLDDLYEQIVADLAATLNKTPARVRTLIDGGPYTAAQAKKAGLIDDVMYRDELWDTLEIDEHNPPAKAARYIHAMHRHRHHHARMLRAPEVAVVYLDGAIHEGRGDTSRGQLGAEGYVRLLHRLARSDRPDAVVLRIASPGGAAAGSDRIRREVHNLAEKKPVIVSLGDVAASGGYLAAVASKPIFAERATLTGSIGVIAGKFALGGLLARLGVAVETFSRGEAAGLFSVQQTFTPAERKRIGALIKDTYTAFKKAVAQGRAMSPQKVNALAEGRVFTGRAALDKTMVDEVGGLGEALQHAMETLEWPSDQPVELIEYPEVAGPLKMLFALGGGQTRLTPLAALTDDLRALERGPYAGLPFRLRIR